MHYYMAEYAQIITILQGGGGALRTPKSHYLICARPFTLISSEQISGSHIIFCYNLVFVATQNLHSFLITPILPKKFNNLKKKTGQVRLLFFSKDNVLIINENSQDKAQTIHLIRSTANTSASTVSTV